jgi:multiple sugar transport system permease protein
MLFVHFIPIIWGILISFIDLDQNNVRKFMRAPFIGLRNFIQIFTSGLDIGNKYIRSIWNILVFGFVCIPIGYVLSFSVALFLNQKFLGRTALRGLILLPWITPDSVMYNVWRFIFQARIGIVNKYLLALGIIDKPIIWLVGNRALSTVILANLWKGWPLTALILLAALQNIPEDLYEAAKIDGANAWQRFRRITFPILLPVSSTILTMGFIWNFHAFNQFYVMLGGDTSAKAAVPSLVIKRYAFDNLEYGISSAMAVVMLLVIFIMSFFVIMRKREET